MNGIKSPTELHITQYISEKKSEILQIIDTRHRILLQANPGAGKTHFFQEIAKDINNGKRKGRLIFVAPFLIITDQFANKLFVDLKLQSGSRKHLLLTDKVITSTFQSLKHIAYELNADDIIIVDEAHALFYNFLKNNTDRQFYISTIQALYHTKAKVVLMSGTPNLSLISTLRLKHVKIIKNKETRAKIHINFSKSKNIDIARYFAFNAINQYGENSLNVIYIKSIKECHNICQMLIELGYNAKVLTSFEKEHSTYLSIADVEVVPNEVQFVVTTNVISTGANIKNANIGTALILNEFSADEIKQFSKRFRSKPDIEIEIVNKPFITKGSSVNLSNIEKQRKYINDTLEYHRMSLENQDYNFDFDHSYNKDNQELITPKEAINRILDINLLQESLYIDKAVDSIDSADDLANLLNEYDDIQAEVMSDYTEIETSENKTNDSDWDIKTKKLIEDFDKNTHSYISAMRSKHIQDWGFRNKIKHLTHAEFIDNTSFSSKIIDNIKSVIFLKEILPSFLKYRGSFKNTKDFLNYLKNSNPKNRNILPISLSLNELFSKYYELVENKNTLGNKYSLKLIDLEGFVNLSNEVKGLLKLIQKTFDYCINREAVTIKEIRAYLEADKDVIEAINKIEAFDRIDADLLKLKNKTFRFSNDILIKALINSLFLVGTRRIGREKITSSEFKTLLPSFHKGEKMNLSNQLILVSKEEEKLKITFGTINPLENKNKFLSNYDLIMQAL